MPTITLYGGAGTIGGNKILLEDPQADGDSQADGGTPNMGGVELMMLNMDPPRHTKLRKLVNTGFTMARINKLEPAVHQVANEILDKVAPRGECDFVT